MSHNVGETKGMFAFSYLEDLDKGYDESEKMWKGSQYGSLLPFDPDLQEQR